MFSLFNTPIRIVIGLAVLGGLLYGATVYIEYLWHSPQNWNPTAEGYYLHSKKLATDSTRWHTDSVGMQNDIAYQTRLIDTLKNEARKALDYGNEWKGKYETSVVQSDATTDRLTDREAELAYYKALQKNGTLSPSVGLIEALKPQSPLVFRAGLKTADREALGKKTLDSLAGALSQLAVSRVRNKNGLQRAGNNFATISRQAKDNASKGGFLWFGGKRKREERRLAAMADSAKAQVDAVVESALEKTLNRDNP